MNIILTRFLFPIKDKIKLSNKFNLYFDNPRNEEEIKYLSKYIKISEDPSKHVVGYGPFIAESREKAGDIPENHWVANFKDYLADFKKNVKGKYIDDFFKKESTNIDNDPISVISKMLIIIRYDDEGKKDKLQKEHLELIKKGEKGFFLLEDDNPIINNFNTSISFSSLLSFISKDNNEYGMDYGFTIHKNEWDLEEYKYDKLLNGHLFNNLLYYYSRNQKDESAEKIDFELALNLYNKWISRLDIFLEESDENEMEKFSYISNELNKVPNLDEKNQLVTLVSIIELLITHNPDFSRFNVEDSISKQFILKVSYLAYLNDNKIDLFEFKKRLKTIYSLRSNIAHGNFKEFNKYVSKLGEEEYFSDIILEIEKILQVILRKYIDDKNFIEFLKVN